MTPTPPSSTPDPRTLRRELGLTRVTLAGVGVILGAGIYVLIGEAASEAGTLVWLSFILAAVVTTLTGLSYAELASMFPRAGAGYEYTRQAFGIHVGFVTGWLTITAEVIGAAAVALGFGQYLNALSGFDTGTGAILLLLVGTAVAATGALGSVTLAALLTLVEAAGLFLVSGIGLTEFDWARVEGGEGVLPLLSGSALVFFAYIGFEDIATFSEEVENPRRTIPLAILLSIGIATTIYVMVAVVAVGAIGAGLLAEATAPLAAVAEIALSSAAGDVLAVFGLAATANTALLLLMASCRRIYGMAATGAIPGFFARVSGGSRVPIVGLGAVGILAALVTLWSDIGEIADVTNFALFVAFAVVNAAVIVLRRRQPDIERSFRTPLSVPLPGLTWVPLLPVLGIASLGVFIVRLDLISILGGIVLLAAGLAIAWLFRNQRNAAAAALAGG